MDNTDPTMSVFVLLLFTHYFSHQVNSFRFVCISFSYLPWVYIYLHTYTYEPTHTPLAPFNRGIAKCTVRDLWFLISGVSIFRVTCAYFFILLFFTLYFRWINKEQNWLSDDEGNPMLCGNVTGARWEKQIKYFKDSYTQFHFRGF